MIHELSGQTVTSFSFRIVLVVPRVVPSLGLVFFTALAPAAPEPRQIRDVAADRAWIMLKA